MQQPDYSYDLFRRAVEERDADARQSSLRAIDTCWFFPGPQSVRRLNPQASIVKTLPIEH